jgi:PKD repeat protein
LKKFLLQSFVAVVLAFICLICWSSISNKSMAAYCTSCATFAENWDWIGIGAVRLNTGNSDSASENCASYTSFNFTYLDPGSTYTLYTTIWAFPSCIGEGCGNPIVWGGVVVWIDFNRDEDFTDPGEIIFQETDRYGWNSSSFPRTKIFTVPMGASLGPTRMRISAKYLSATNSYQDNPLWPPPTSCEWYTYGEVQDYTVRIGPAPNISVALSASPMSGSAPLTGVDLIGDVTGTATGNIRYRFDCNNDGVWESDNTVTSDSYAKTDLCSYTTTGIYTAKVEATREGLVATNTTTITVNSLPQYNVYGWAWSDNVGHISFNCNNDYNGNNTMGPAYMSELENRCGTSNYGVDIDLDTGIFSGYAWSDNVGWISFNQSDLVGCPESPCQAHMSTSTGEVFGWGKAINSISQNYGWISLNGSDYQVNIGLSTGEFHNYAYGGGPSNEAVIGWTSFNCQEGGANQSNICGTSNYLVWTDPIIVNNPPTVGPTDTAGPSQEDLCNNRGRYFLGWIFQDTDSGAYENTYELKLTNTGTGVSGTYSPGPQLPRLIENGGRQTLGVLVGTNENLSSIPITVKYGQTYIWEVRVQDDGELWSSWKSGPGSFTVPLNYPEVGFSFSPLRPKIGDEMTFQDTSTDHSDGYPIQRYLWDFGDSTTATTQNATHTYNEVYPRTVTHTIYFDTINSRSCSTSTTFNVRPGQPEYIEVIPRTGANIFNALKKWLLGIF